MKVVIVGKPNVGKSCIFNRLLGQRRTLVHNLPGVTRDRIEKTVTWNTKDGKTALTLVDTGGVGGELFDEEIRSQVEIAVNEAQIILFVVDGRAGLDSNDELLLSLLRKSGCLESRPVILVVNKIDSHEDEARVGEFYSMGIDPVVTVSAEHDRGFSELGDEILKIKEEGRLGEAQVNEEISRLPKIALIGQPNVGKSTLLNGIVGEKRVIAHPKAGTTSDSIDCEITWNRKPYVLIDTAGIRRKDKTQKGLEVLSVVQSKKTIERAELAILVIDAERGISDQDEKISGMITESGCSLVIFVNKWDLHEDSKEFTKREATKRIRAKMGHLAYVPIVFGSALNESGLKGLGNTVARILSQRHQRISTPEMNQWIKKEAEVYNPWNAKFYYCHQAGRNPPSFICHVNQTKKVHFSLKRHLVNAMRTRWGYEGTPIRLSLKGK